MLLRSHASRAPPLLPSSPPSSLAVAPPQLSDLLRAVRPVVPFVLASLVTDSSVPVSSLLALVAAVTDFASTRRLDYATALLSDPACPPPVGGVASLGSDVLEDRQHELAFLSEVAPHLCSMLPVPASDPDSLDIPTTCTYAEATSGPWASQWIAAMEQEMASWRSTSTFVDAVPLHRVNVVDGRWLFKVKRPPREPPVFKARYVARGFN
ncbi:hypothetical protein CLOP_g21917 [Closterium sp. NIES-67]|nr:hypothetical protein CLOP_g21917 [Closterium sp. NIES-67]